MLTWNMLHPLLQQNVHNGVPLHGHKPGYVVSIRLYARPPHSDLLSRSFRCFKNRLKWFSCILLYIFFRKSVRSETFKLLQNFKKVMYDSDCTDPFPQLPSSVDDCNGN